MGKTQKVIAPAVMFWIRRQLMALREEDMLAMLEMGWVTGKPQLHLWAGTAGEKVF